MKIRELLLFALICNPSVVFGQLIPNDRRIDWAAGVRGGIPTRTTLINVRNAPFNATGNGSTDDRAAIQRAIDAAREGEVVFLPPGTYVVGDQLRILNKNNVTLRGAGPRETTIRYNGSRGIHIILADRTANFGNPIAINSGLAKGSTQLTLANASSANVGTVVFISQLNDPSFVTSTGYGSACTWCGRNDPNRTMVQVDKVTARSGNVVTLERPLYLGLSASRQPQLRTMAVSTGVGIEDLTVWRTNAAAVTGVNIMLLRQQNGWVKNVASRNAGQRHIELQIAYACEVRECDLRNDLTWQNLGGDRSYALMIFGINSDHLIVNNIMFRNRYALVFEGGGAGCVVAYNYAAGGVQDPVRAWLASDLDTHGSHPFMNLFEGNVVSKINHDNTFGSASHNTSFRNHIVNWSDQATTPVIARFGADVQANSLFNNFVGNVIGQPGDTGQRFATNGMSNRTLCSYRFGFFTPGGTTITDQRVAATTQVHGNFDFIGNGIIWDPTNNVRTLPASLYLHGRPNWWPPTLPWPAIGPDLNPRVGMIPAELRFKGIPPPPPSNEIGVLDHKIVPTIPVNSGDRNAVNLGLNFRPTVAGSVIAIWFYRNGTANYDFVNLWGESGNLLAQARVTVNSGVGWNRQPLQSAVQLRVGEIYTVSYHVTAGAFPVTPRFFSDDNELLLGGADQCFSLFGDSRLPEPFQHHRPFRRQ
jgi:hypothetical protein